MESLTGEVKDKAQWARIADRVEELRRASAQLADDLAAAQALASSHSSALIDANTRVEQLATENARLRQRLAATVTPGRRYDQCDGTCTVDCGHCKGAGRPNIAEMLSEEIEAVMRAESDRLAASGDARAVEQGIGVAKAMTAVSRAIRNRLDPVAGRRTWQAPAEPGPNVAALRSELGTVWANVGDGYWQQIDPPYSGNPVDFWTLLGEYGPLTDATTEVRSG